MRLVDYLHQNAQRYSSKLAVVCGDSSLTYAQLWQEVVNHASLLTPANTIHQK